MTRQCDHMFVHILVAILLLEFSRQAWEREDIFPTDFGESRLTQSGAVTCLTWDLVWG